MLMYIYIYIYIIWSTIIIGVFGVLIQALHFDLDPMADRIFDILFYLYVLIFF